MRVHAIAVLSVFLCTTAAGTALAQAPAPPESVRKERISNTQVRITWEDASDDEDGFEILRRPTGASEYESRGVVGANVTEFVDEALKDTVFVYRVRSFQGEDDSRFSNECYVNRSPADVPLSFNARLIALYLVRVSWSDQSAGERGFLIQRALPGKRFKTIARVPANTEEWDDDTLAPATSYIYRMRALGRPAICWGDSKLTPERAVTTKGGVRILQVEMRARGEGMVTSNPPGISCGYLDDHCAAEFPLAKDVTLTAKPRAGSRFAGWVDIPKCEDSNDPCTINLEENRTIGAAFRLN